ncbi:hypothetical protein DJ71_04535, partial [Halorubrum sp. E3]
LDRGRAENDRPRMRAITAESPHREPALPEKFHVYPGETDEFADSRAVAASADQVRRVDSLGELRSTDFRRESDLGRFVAGNEPYLVR